MEWSNDSSNHFQWLIIGFNQSSSIEWWWTLRIQARNQHDWGQRWIRQPGPGCNWWRLGFSWVFWGAKIVPKVTSNHSASWIGFQNAERSESFLKGHTVSDFTFLMANSSCLGSANLCRLLHWLENHRKSPGSWPQFLHPHHISIAKVGQNWQRSSHDQAWHYSQSSQPVQRQQIQAVSRCFIIVGAKTRPTRPSHLFIIAAIFIGGLQSALDLKGWHLNRKVQETHGTSRNIFQNLASLRICCEFPLSTFINVILLVWILPPKNSNLPGVHGRATVQKSGLGIIQVMQVSKTPGRTPGSNPFVISLNV